jgi:pimeloyl-ACP methyl ester carboxylesterase
MIRNLLLGLLATVVVAVTLAALALRDNPARSAIGETRVADNRGAQIRYVVSGPAGAPLVPLLASFARSASDFNELVLALNAGGYRTLALQARGVEGSDLPSMRPSLFDYAGDLAAALDAERVTGRVVLVGHAYGNRIARAFASRYPQRVDSLILLAAGDSAPPPETRDAIMTVLLQVWPEASRRHALQKAFFANGNAAPDYWLSGWYPRAGLAQAHATANTPSSQWNSGGDVPMLILQPLHDAAAAEGAQVLLQRFPQRVRVIDLIGAGHAILPEQPLRVRDIVLQHLGIRLAART